MAQCWQCREFRKLNGAARTRGNLAGNSSVKKFTLPNSAGPRARARKSNEGFPVYVCIGLFTGAGGTRAAECGSRSGGSRRSRQHFSRAARTRARKYDTTPSCNLLSEEADFNGAARTLRNQRNRAVL